MNRSESDEFCIYTVGDGVLYLLLWDDIKLSEEDILNELTLLENMSEEVFSRKRKWFYRGKSVISDNIGES